MRSLYVGLVVGLVAKTSIASTPANEPANCRTKKYTPSTANVIAAGLTR